MTEAQQKPAGGRQTEGEPTPPEAPRVHGLTCPSCGGSLGVHSGLRVVTCSYCETPLLVLSEIGVRRSAVGPEIEGTRAREVAQRWLTRGWNKDSRLRRGAEMGEAVLCFLPFYRMEADCIGIALGTEERTRTVGSGKKRRVERYEVDVERTVERSFDFTRPAVNVAEWGIAEVDLQGDRLEAFDQRQLERLGMVFPPTGSEVSFKTAALERFKRRADPSAGLKRVRFRYLESLRERLSIIYYPLWIVRYRFLGRSYQVLVDAEDGSLAYGKAPGNDLYRALMLVASQAAILFVMTSILQFAGFSAGGFAVMGLFTLMALLWGWRKFRHGGVVIEGTGVAGRSDLLASLRKLSRQRKRHELMHDLLTSKGRRSGS
jgi:hypothetical protein